MFTIFADEVGIAFPVPSNLFVGYLNLLKTQSAAFRALIETKLGTASPGLAGGFFFASETLQADALVSEDSLSGNALESWTNFAGLVNMETPPGVPNVHAQSDAFLNAYRSEQTITSTITTWFFANEVCFAIILSLRRILP